MEVAAHHALLGLSVAALGGAAIRLASLAAPAGLERAVATAVLAAAAAVMQALGLGLVGLGTDTVALSLAAAVTWLGACLLLPAPEVRLREEIAAWWLGLDPRGWIAAAAVVGAAAAFCAWTLRHPSIGLDPTIYHYVEVAIWVQNGHPGQVEALSYGFPFGNYPLTNEVLLAWGAGISRSFVPLSLWPWAMLTLLGAAGWLGLRTLRVPPLPRMLALVALLSAPWIVRELNEPLTDLAALAWLVSAAALCAAAARRPALLAPALVAAGLALGTKTTTAVPLLAVLLIALLAARGRLRPLAVPLAAAGAVAVAVGGVWYLRNLIQHGSPAWPFTATAWGDPVPHFLSLIDVRFIERPMATVEGRFENYVEHLGGGLILLGGALIAPLLSRRRDVLLASGITAIALLAWSAAPVTGLTRSSEVDPPGVWSLSATRYLLPVFACSSLTLALAARAGGRAGTVATVALAGAVAWNFGQDADLGLPYVPQAATLLAGAAAGLLAGAALRVIGPWLAARPIRSPVLGVVAMGLVAAGLGVAMAPVARGYVERHGDFPSSTSLAGQQLAKWFSTQPDFDSGDAPIATSGRFMVGELSGDRFQHPLVLIPRNESCARVAARAREGWVVIVDADVADGLLGVGPYPSGRCLAGRRPLYDKEGIRVYRTR